jgi:hypothetical protein
MHNISDSEEYLNKMSRSTSIDIALEDRGLWGAFLHTLGIKLAKNTNKSLVKK